MNLDLTGLPDDDGKPRDYPMAWPKEVTEDIQRHMNDIYALLKMEFPQHPYAGVLLLYPAHALSGKPVMFGRFTNLPETYQQIVMMRVIANTLEAQGLTQEISPEQPRPAPKGKLGDDA